MGKSATEFVKAVFRKWGWLVTGVVGGGVFVLNLLGIDPSVSRIVGATILVVCLLVACFLAYHELYMTYVTVGKSETKVPILRRVVYRRPDYRQRDALNTVIETMKRLHGHSDDNELERDYLDGVLVCDLLSKNCTRCGKPRNQQGDDMFYG